MPLERETMLTPSGRLKGNGASRSSTRSDVATALESVPGPADADASARRRFAERHATVAIAILILAGGIAVRVAMAVQDKLGHLPDTDFFVAWTRSLFEHGIGGFHAATSFCDYPPLFLLIMWAIGQGAAVFDSALSSDHLLRVLLKVPACLADLGIAVVLMVEGRRLLGGRRAVGAAALYFLNPVAIYNSAYWGQVDAIHTLFVLLGVVLITRRQWGLAGAFVALALLQKFQSIAFVPLLLFEAYSYRRWRGIASTLVGGIVAAAFVLLPFALQGTMAEVLHRGYVGVVGQYGTLSPSAFNVWHLIGGAEITDSVLPATIAQAAAGGQVSMPADGSLLLWLSWRNISLVAFSLCVALILSIYSYRPGAIARTGAAGLLAMAFFLIPTEMHERYAHPAIALLALWAVSGIWKERVFFLLSAMLLLNLTTILPAGDIASHIAAMIVSLFVVMLIWAGASKRRDGLNNADAAVHVFPAELAPPNSHIINWFRRGTYLALLFACVGSVAITHAASQTRSSMARPDENTAYLSSLDPVHVRQDWGTPHPDRTVLGGVLQLDEAMYLRGLGTHAASELTYEVPEGFDVFRAIVGIDASTDGAGSAIASIDLEGKAVFETPTMTGRTQALEVEVPLNGARTITLRVIPTSDGNNADHVDWALARFERTRAAQRRFDRRLSIQG